MAVIGINECVFVSCVVMRFEVWSLELCGLLVFLAMCFGGVHKCIGVVRVGGVVSDAFDV